MLISILFLRFDKAKLLFFYKKITVLGAKKVNFCVMS